MAPVITVFGATYFIATMVASLVNANIMISMIVIGLIGFILALCFVKHKAKAIVLTIFISIIFANLLFCYKTQVSYNKVIALNETTAKISGVVTDIKSNKQFTVKVESIHSQNFQQPFKIIVNTFEEVELNYYDKITCEVDIIKINNSSSKFQKSNNVYVYGYGKKIDITTCENKPLQYHLIKLNHNLCDIVDKMIPQPYNGLVKSILFGERDQIANEVYNNINSIGLAHLLSISGFHIGIIAAFLIAIFKKILPKRVANLLAIIAIWGYTALTGLNVATLRAAIMMTLCLIGEVLGQEYYSINSLCFALSVILMLNPFYIYNFGFLLSFGATLGVLSYYKKVEEYILIRFNVDNLIRNKIINKIVKYCITVFSMSFAANLFSLPILAFMTSRIGLIAILSNLITIPLVGLVMPLGIIAIVASPIPFVGMFIGKIIWGLSYLIDKTSLLFGKIPFAMIPINFDVIRYWAVITVVYIVIMIAFLKGRKKLSYIASTSVVSLLVGVLLSVVVYTNVVEITSFSGYRGKSVVYTYAGKATVVNLEDDEFINQSVQKFLYSKGIYNIDTLILADNKTKDIDGLKKTTQRYNVKAIIKHPENNANEFVGEGTTFINSGEEINVRQGKLMQIGVQNQDNIINISTHIGKAKINITQNLSNDKNTNYDIYYFYGKYDKYVTTFNNKCAIMLSNYDEKNKLYIDGYNNSTTMLVNANGNIRLRR